MQIRNSPYIIAMRHTPDEYCDIGTERLLLQTLEAEEITDTILEWFNEAEVRRFLPLQGGVYDFPALQKLVRGHNNKSGFLFWITPRDDRERQIGFVQLQINQLHSLASVVVCLGASEWWGKGAVSEARGAVLDFAFRKMACEKVVANCQQADAGALWAFEAEGWAHEAILRRHNRVGTERVDMIHYAMFRDDWMRRIDDWNAARLTQETDGEDAT